MEQNTGYFELSTAQHIWGGFFTNHQYLITLYLQYLALLRPVLLPVVDVGGLELISQPSTVPVQFSLMSDTVDKVL